MITSKVAKAIGVELAIFGLAVAGFASLYALEQADYGASSGPGAPPTINAPTPATSPAADYVDLTDTQLSSVKVEPVG